MQLPDEVLSALAEGRQAYVAIETSNGPHVTPELYAWSNDALWIAAATTTLKTRVLERHPTAAAIVVRLAGRDVVLTGPVDVFDVRKPADIARRATKVPEAVAAGARFAVRNAHDLLAFAGDAVTGRLGRRLPPPRVLFGLHPQRAALVEGDALVEAWEWPVPDGAQLDDGSVPAGGDRAVAAVPGPVALPCRWFDDDQRVFIPPSLLSLAGVGPRFPLAVVVDQYNAPGPAAKWGRLVRGEGACAEEPGHVDMTIDEIVEWNGVDVSRTS